MSGKRNNTKIKEGDLHSKRVFLNLFYEDGLKNRPSSANEKDATIRVNYFTDRTARCNRKC